MLINGESVFSNRTLDNVYTRFFAPLSHPSRLCSLYDAFPSDVCLPISSVLTPATSTTTSHIGADSDAHSFLSLHAPKLWEQTTMEGRNRLLKKTYCLVNSPVINDRHQQISPHEE